jgi:hypothetical protein
MKLKRLKLLFCLFLGYLSFPGLLLSQPDPPGGGPGGGDPPVGGSPVGDGVIFILIFAGIYGLYLGWIMLKKHREWFDKLTTSKRISGPAFTEVPAGRQADGSTPFDQAQGNGSPQVSR